MVVLADARGSVVFDVPRNGLGPSKLSWSKFTMSAPGRRDALQQLS